MLSTLLRQHTRLSAEPTTRGDDATPRAHGELIPCTRTPVHRPVLVMLAWSALVLLAVVLGRPRGPALPCSDTAPPPADYSCREQSQWGKCDEEWMQGFCEYSCNHCAMLVEDDDGLSLKANDSLPPAPSRGAIRSRLGWSSLPLGQAPPTVTPLGATLSSTSTDLGELDPHESRPFFTRAAAACVDGSTGTACVTSWGGGGENWLRIAVAPGSAIAAVTVYIVKPWRENTNTGWLEVWVGGEGQGEASPATRCGAIAISREITEAKPYADLLCDEALVGSAVTLRQKSLHSGVLYLSEVVLYPPITMRTFTASGTDASAEAIVSAQPADEMAVDDSFAYEMITSDGQGAGEGRSPPARSSPPQPARGGEIVAEINRRFSEGRPSGSLTEAGVLIHVLDGWEPEAQARRDRDLHSLSASFTSTNHDRAAGTFSAAMAHVGRPPLRLAGEQGQLAPLPSGSAVGHRDLAARRHPLRLCNGRGHRRPLAQRVWQHHVHAAEAWG